jgi:hypothetical protein
VNEQLNGPFIVVTHSGHVFGATSIEATATDFIVRLKNLEHRLKPADIAVAYQIDPAHPAAQIDPGILSTVTALEKLMVEFAEGRTPPVITLFGSGSLAVTILPERSTNDLDAIVSDEFAAFANRRGTETDITIEMLDEKLLALLGPWSTRTASLYGPLGIHFRLVHPLDTVMQKLLRFSPEQFAGKDQGDIAGVLAILQPSAETLLDLLTENPARYARLSGRFASQADAIERNTRWFLGAYLPQLTFELVLQRTGDRAVEPAVAGGFLPTLPAVDFRNFLRRTPQLEK